MLFLTKGEFIQALKDYQTYKERAEWLKNKYQDLYYLRYEKVRSPLDYDIIGYKNGEAVRQLKTRGSYNESVVTESQDKLEAEMVACLEKRSNLVSKINNVECELDKFQEPLKSILTLRYIEHAKLKVVCKKFKNMYLDEAGMHKYIHRELDKYYQEDALK